MLYFTIRLYLMLSLIVSLTQRSVLSYSLLSLTKVEMPRRCQLPPHHCNHYMYTRLLSTAADAPPPTFRSLEEINLRELEREEVDGDYDDDSDTSEDEDDDDDDDDDDEDDDDDDDEVTIPLTSSQSPSPTPGQAAKTKQKQKQKQAYVPFPLNEADLEESFVRGGGPGGQAINKHKSMVQLIHKPTGTRVHCQEARDLTTNRRIARKLMRDKLDLLENGSASRLGRQYDKIRKKKAKRKSRSGAKYGERKGASESKLDPPPPPEAS